MVAPVAPVAALDSESSLSRQKPGGRAKWHQETLISAAVHSRPAFGGEASECPKIVYSKHMRSKLVRDLEGRPQDD